MNSEKTNHPIREQTKDLKRHLTKEDLQMLKEHMKNYTMSLAIREVQIKAQWATPSHPLE